MEENKDKKEEGAATTAPETKTVKDVKKEEKPKDKPKGNPNLNAAKVIKVNEPKDQPVEEPKKGIQSDGEALKLFKKSYKLPEGDDFAYVCEDGNVFFKINEGSAMSHAKLKGIKIFIVKP